MTEALPAARMNEVMRICHVITRLILGGAQENTVLTCEGLHDRGHEVTLITGPALGPEGELLTRARAGGYRVIELDALRREISLRRDRRAYGELVSVLRQLQPEIMHSHSSKAGILARKAAKKVGGMQIVHTVHGLPYHRYEKWWKNRLYIELEKRAALRSDAIICVADAMTRQAVAAGVGVAGQYLTIYSGMDTQRFISRPAAADTFRDEFGIPADSVLVTQVSRLAELKGHKYIIEAARRITEGRVHFCFVGDGHLQQQITRQIERAGLADRFTLTGLLPAERIPEVMHATDILVHCSLREGLARALPQAMLAGIPVVSFDVDGAGEVVDSDTGILLEPKDTAGLALAISTLAESPQLRDILGGAGRERCREMFDKNFMVDQIEQIYRQLLK